MYPVINLDALFIQNEKSHCDDKKSRKMEIDGRTHKKNRGRKGGKKL